MAANAGRKATPHNLKLIEGQRPGRDSGGRKVGTPPAFRRVPPEKPDHLSAYAEVLWDRVVDQLPQLGLLKDLDGPLLEMLCETYSVWREAKDKRIKLGILGKNSQGVVVAPWLKAEHDAANMFRALCPEFGLSPAAEMKLAGPPSPGSGQPNDNNPYAN